MTMSLVMSDGSWWDGDSKQRVVATGKSGAVVISRVSGGSRQQGVFETYEKIGYVARGCVRLYIVDLSDETRGRELPEGSFFRIPGTLAHWFTNSDERGAVVIEGLVDDGIRDWDEAQESIPLFADWEDREEFMQPRPQWMVAPDQYRMSEADEKKSLENPPQGLTKT